LAGKLTGSKKRLAKPLEVSQIAIYFVVQSAFNMDQQQQSLEALQDIKRMMERSSRFISLSGWSGIAAGLCALVGAWLAQQKIVAYKLSHHIDIIDYKRVDRIEGYSLPLVRDLFVLAAIVLAAAVISAFFFTYIRSKKSGIPVWGNSARRLMWNTIGPMLVGAVVILKLLLEGDYWLIAPLCLIFYGLALVNGSKYTLGEVRFLGYAQILLGLINLFMVGSGLTFWAIGFGVLHIVYGFIMWWKHERNVKS
jgi:hypothetical protein